MKATIKNIETTEENVIVDIDISNGKLIESDKVYFSPTVTKEEIEAYAENYLQAVIKKKQELPLEKKEPDPKIGELEGKIITI